MSLLSIVRDVCSRVGLTQPSQAFGSTDVQIQQIVGLANEEGQALSERYEWQALIREATFITRAVEAQGSLTQIAPGVKRIINDTIWNRTQGRPILGPVPPSSWQQTKASNFNGPIPRYRIRNNLMLFDAAPTAGEECWFEYITKNWVRTATAETNLLIYSQDFNQWSGGGLFADTDVQGLDGSSYFQASQSLSTSVSQTVTKDTTKKLYTFSIHGYAPDASSTLDVTVASERFGAGTTFHIDFDAETITYGDPDETFTIVDSGMYTVSTLENVGGSAHPDNPIQRAWITFVSDAATSLLISHVPGSSTAPGVWGAQLEEGAELSPYEATTADGAESSASAFTDDANTIVFDEAIFTLGVIWRWKKAKGLEYAEDKDQYERRILDAIAADGSKDWLSLEGERYDITPALVVPAGSWSLP